MKNIGLISLLLIFCFNCFSQQDSISIQNRIIESSKGSWRSPIRRYSAILKSYFIEEHSGTHIPDSALIFVSDSAFEIIALISGEILTNRQEEYYSISIVSGDYILTIWGVATPLFTTGDFVKKGQPIAVLSKLPEDLDYRVTISLINNKGAVDLRKWFAIKYFN